MKKVFLVIASCLLLTSCGTSYEYSHVNYDDSGYTMPILDEEKVTVSFYYNISKQEINLNSGLYATGTDIALKIDQITKGSKVSKPDIDPVRKNFEFDGWHLDASNESKPAYATASAETASATIFLSSLTSSPDAPTVPRSGSAIATDSNLSA